MARGRQPGVYTTDGGTDYRMQVEKDRFADATFNWSTAGAALNQVPRGAKLRHVTGLSASSGRRGTATVPNITADVWTGVAGTWLMETDDLSTDTMTIVQRIGERPAMS
jgi:hypothetical protein